MSGIYVPVINCGESTLFKISSTESDDFLINGILPHNEDNDEDSAKITSVVEKIEKVFGKNVEEIQQQLSIINKDDPDIELQFDDSTQSITLGLISELHREENHLTFKSQWDYAVVTGDVAENFRLERVEFIEKKFEAVKVLAAKEPEKKIIFIYINDDLPIPRGYDKNFPNIYVAPFTSNTKIEYIYAELFTPEFDEKQQELLRNTTNLNEKKFYETKTFLELKSEISKFNGFFIEGKSNSGKSILANALVLYAMEIELAYAPIWVSINNVEIQNILTARNKNQNLYEYFQKQIESEKNEPQKKYILVIDNLEVNSNYINDILRSVHEILQKDDSIIFTIITSWQNPSHTELFCKGKVNFKTVSLSDTAKEDFYGIYKTIYDIHYSNYLQKAAVEEQYELREQSYKWLKDRPGNIPFIFNYLDKKPVKELIEYLETRDPSEAEWNEKFIGMSFDQLGLFAKIVLFVFTRDFGCKNEKCSAKSDYEKIKAVIQREGIIEGDFITRESINDAFSEILSHYLLQENAEGAFYIKNDVLQYLLFNNDAKTSKLNEHFINENEKIQATILYNWTEKITDLITEQNRNHVLFEIAKYANNPELFDKCLDGEIDLNRKNQDGLTLLHVAVKQNPNPEIIKYLINKGADWKLLTNNENTLIHLAVENPNVEVLRYLLEQNLFEKVDSKNSLGLTPYDRAAGVAENIQVFELLEKYGHELSEETFQQALSRAAENNPNVEVIKYLIEEKNVKTNIEDTDGATLLHYAAKNPSIEVLKYVLENHFYDDINKIDKTGIASIIYSEDTMEDPFDHSFLKFLQESSYFQNTKNWLAEHPDVSNDKEIQEALPKLELLTENNYEGIGATPLHYAAAFNCNPQALDLLIENGADWHKTSDDFSLIMIAAALNNESVVSHILEQKWFNLNSGKNKTSGNVLHMAARNPNAEVMRLFCKTEFRKYINTKDSYGYTPLLTALEHNPNIKTIEVLLENKADYKSKTKYNLSTLLCAAKNKNPEVFEYILEHRIFDNRAIRKRDNSGHTVLMYSLLPQFNPKLFETLVEVYKMDPNDLDDEKNTLLHLAVMVNNEKMVEELINESYISTRSLLEKFVFSMTQIWAKTHISNDADRIKDKVKELNQYYKWDINKKNSRGQTALDFAICPARNLKIADILLKNGAHPGDKNGALLDFACMTESWDIVPWIIDKKVYKNLSSETKDLIKQHCPDLSSLL